jgi:hypothetical protein
VFIGVNDLAIRVFNVILPLRQVISSLHVSSRNRLSTAKSGVATFTYKSGPDDLSTAMQSSVCILHMNGSAEGRGFRDPLEPNG